MGARTETGIKAKVVCMGQGTPKMAESARGAALAGLAALLVVLPALCGARTVRVPEEAPTLQAGIDSTAAGDTVLVAPGRYSGTGNRDIRFRGRSIVVRGSGGPGVTVVDVQGSPSEPHRGFLFDAQETPAAVLEGFSVENGYMSTLPSKAPRAAHDLSAGGIKIQDASPTIRDCVIRNCGSEYTGGGMSIEFLSEPRLEGVTVQGCSAGLFGGGISIETISNPLLVDCVVTGNRAANGGGVALLANATLVRCTIAGNAVVPGGLGGGVVVDFPARASLDRCIVWGNCGTAPEGEITIGPGGQLTLACSAFDSARVIADGTLVQAGINVEEAPGFCFPLGCRGAPVAGGDYRLQAGSPCLAAASPCGQQIGPLGEGCPQQTSVESLPWGRIKVLYRGERRAP